MTDVYFWYSEPNWHCAKVRLAAFVARRSSTISGMSQRLGASACSGHHAQPPRLDAGFSIAQKVPCASAAVATLATNATSALCLAR
jgi:hypothetical protein